MSRYYNGYLGNPDQGLFFRDWQHAARLYVDDIYRLAPKTKFLYYVVFNFNESSIANTAFQQQNRQELNFIVKKTDLPKYTLNIENLNQYNRKTTTYTRMTYEPVNITFHDDNNGVSNAMWAMYYSHYFADRLNSQTPYSDINPVAYKNHAYDPKSGWPYRYGLDTSTGIEPFFNSIQLMTLSKHKFTSYLLCHPRITSWQHDTMDQSEGNGIVENNMSVAYDAVIYTTGTVAYDNPSGFGTLHYDQAQSPLGPSNQAFLQGALNSIYSQDLMGVNPFNPIDLGISVLAGSRQLATVGNQAPYGSSGLLSTGVLPGALSSYATYSSTSTSGFQNYDFGGSTNPTTINQVLRSPVDESYNSGALARQTAISDQFTASLKGANAVDPPITTDVYSTNLPKDTPSSVESKIFNGYNTGVTIPEAPGAVNIDYFVESDVASNRSITSNELINNNPQNPDVPDDPFS
jgi:hypothetical protein